MQPQYIEGIERQLQLGVGMTPNQAQVTMIDQA